MNAQLRKKTFWEAVTEPSSYESGYKLGPHDELRGKALWMRHCGQRMRVLGTYMTDSQGRLYPLIKRYYCEKCHIATLVDQF